MCRPFEGLLEPPWPMPSGRITYHLVMSRRPPGLNRTSANTGFISDWPLPPVPCSPITALITWPFASRLGWPSVV